MPTTFQVVLPDEMAAMIDDHVARMAAIYPGSAPARSAVLRQWLAAAAPEMERTLKAMERETASRRQESLDLKPKTGRPRR